ncbi:mobilization protein [Siphonobacter sp. BAB-5385]|uniref:site-specific integrase n=1 Tax=Siphonobacter sp. BAB-5385 TaxID=1864822 RepID=UPI000B9E1ECC|nr:site-specific integrase [Siphonobacter sp. BAB-5385]OZI09575.1 mobilization protein [Siphonobacter sp. BAB-5385]
MALRKTTAKETVRLREKDLKDGVKSLFLDIYLNGKRTYEYLKLYLIPPKSAADRSKNKETLQLAQSIRAKRQVEIQNKEYGFSSAFKLELNFLEYFERVAKERLDSKGNYGNWDSALKHLEKYCKSSTTFKDVDVKFVEGFRTYLEKKARTKSGTPLSQNTKHSYFNKLKACLKQSFEEGILPINPNLIMESPKAGEPDRSYLTLDEIKALIKTECRYPVLKRAFLFACLTGLRWSDVQKLTWREVQEHGESVRLRYTQKKTKSNEYLDISKQAEPYLGQRGKADERVFVGLKYSAWHNMELQKWCMKAGIEKSITFHCARHTFAVLMLDLGAEIFTVSKLLGHKDLKTTQIYAKVMDKKKQDAVNMIPDLNL